MYCDACYKDSHTGPKVMETAKNKKETIWWNEITFEFRIASVSQMTLKGCHVLIGKHRPPVGVWWGRVFCTVMVFKWRVLRFRLRAHAQETSWILCSATPCLAKTTT